MLRWFVLLYLHVVESKILIEYFCGNFEGTRTLVCPDRELVGQASVCESRIWPNEECTENKPIDANAIVEQRTRSLNCEGMPNCSFNVNSWLPKISEDLKSDQFIPHHFKMSVKCFQVKEMCSDIISSSNLSEGQYLYDQTEGFLTSPWYPEEYGANTFGQCYATIVVKEHMKISLKVVDFNLPENALCGNDRLDVSGRRENISGWIHMYSWCGTKQSDMETLNYPSIYKRMTPPREYINSPYSQIHFVLENRPAPDTANIGRKFKIKWTSSSIILSKRNCNTISCKDGQMHINRKENSSALLKNNFKMDPEYKRLAAGIIMLTLFLSGLQCLFFHIHQSYRKAFPDLSCLRLFVWILRRKKDVESTNLNSSYDESATKDISEPTGIKGPGYIKTYSTNRERILLPEEMHFRKPIAKELLEVTIYGANTLEMAALTANKENINQTNVLKHNTATINEIDATKSGKISRSVSVSTIENLLIELTGKIENIEYSLSTELGCNRVHRFNPLSVISKSSCPYRMSGYV